MRFQCTPHLWVINWINLESHKGKVLKSLMDESVSSLNFPKTEEEQYGFRTGRSTMNCLYWDAIWNWKLKQKTHVLLLFWSEGSVWLNRLWPLPVLVFEKSFTWKSNCVGCKCYQKQRKIAPEWMISSESPSIHPLPFPSVVIYHPYWFSIFLKGSLEKYETKYKYADDKASLWSPIASIQSSWHRKGFAENGENE